MRFGIQADLRYSGKRGVRHFRPQSAPPSGSTSASSPGNACRKLAARFELEVNDRRSSDAHIDAIVRKRSLDFRQVLELLRREELQEACEALGLDAGGREKAKLVERILGREQHVPSEAAETPNGSSEIKTSPPRDAVSAGALKSELRRFVLEVAGGYKNRDAADALHVPATPLLRLAGRPAAGGRDPRDAGCRRERRAHSRRTWPCSGEPAACWSKWSSTTWCSTSPGRICCGSACRSNPSRNTWC